MFIENDLTLLFVLIEPILAGDIVYKQFVLNFGRWENNISCLLIGKWDGRQKEDGIQIVRWKLYVCHQSLFFREIDCRCRFGKNRPYLSKEVRDFSDVLVICLDTCHWIILYKFFDFGVSQSDRRMERWTDGPFHSDAEALKRILKEMMNKSKKINFTSL